MLPSGEWIALFTPRSTGEVCWKPWNGESLFAAFLATAAVAAQCVPSSMHDYRIKWNLFSSERVPLLRNDIVRTDFVRLNEVQIAGAILIFDTEQNTQHECHTCHDFLIAFSVFFFFFPQQKYHFYIFVHISKRFSATLRDFHKSFFA